MTKKNSKYAAYLEAQMEQLLAKDPSFRSELASNPQKAIEHRLKTKLNPKLLGELLAFLKGRFKWVRQSELSDADLAGVVGGVEGVGDLPGKGRPMQMPPSEEVQTIKLPDGTEIPLPKGQKILADPVMANDAFSAAPQRRHMPRSNRVNENPGPDLPKGLPDPKKI